MAIQPGDKMPAGSFGTMTESGPGSISADELFTGNRVVLFAVPGAFTPTCSVKHLPGFLDRAGELAGRGVDTVACMAVNDVFVMDAWARDQQVDGKVLMLSDGNGDYAKALGLELDGSAFNMGIRSQRFAIIVDDGVARDVLVDEPGKFELSSADAVLERL